MIRQSFKMLLPFVILLFLHSSVQQGTVSTTNTNSTITGTVSTTITNSTSTGTGSTTITNSTTIVIVTTNTNCSDCANATSNSTTSTEPWPAVVNEWLTSQYSYAAYVSFQFGLQLRLQSWRTIFSEAQKGIAVGTLFNYTECSSFLTSKYEMKCDMSSTIVAKSVVIMNLHAALTLKPEERSQVCVSYKASVKTVKNIAAECQKESPENWQKYSTAKYLQHFILQDVDVFKTMQHLLCTSYPDSSEVTVPDGSCDKGKIRDYLLAFVRISLSVDNGVGCSDVSLAIEAIVSALELCPYEIRSALSPLVARMKITFQTTCTTPTCNIAYVDSLASETLQILKETDHTTSPLSPVATDGICKHLKSVLAIFTSRTIDCSVSVYDSVSMQINSVLEEHVKRCGKLPLEPKPCVRTALNPHDIIWGLGTSFFSSKEMTCQAVTKFQVKDKVIDSYCTGSAPKPEDVISCLSKTITSKSSPCERTSWTIIEQLNNARACLSSIGTNDITIEKGLSFMRHLQKTIPFEKTSPVCAADNKFEQILFNATISILNGEKDPAFCLTLQVDIDQWFTQCGNSKLDKNNITAFFSLVCLKSLQLPAGCSVTGCSTCFSTAWPTLDAVQISAVNQCVQAAGATCSGSVSLEVQAALKYLASAAEILSPPINDSNCVCDPPAAVNCIMEVHHLFKQTTPDYQGLCPKVQESDTCARSYLQGCDECKKTTVLNIVHKLNSQLEETCLDPPVTLCPAISALQCVTDLEDLLASSQTISNDTICIEITKARQCVNDKTEHCDDLTTLTILKKLEYTISKIKNLDCKPPEDQLKLCSKVFNSNAEKILGTNKQDCLIALQNNDKTLWDALTAQCAELDISFACLNATLGLLRDDVEAVIVRKALKAVYDIVKEVCKPPPPQLQCYSCDADVKDSCANVTTSAIKTCNETEVCVTTTLVNPNGTAVKHKGCSSRTDCKPGCDQKGCTYCCSGNLCNNQDNGPTLTCDLKAAVACGLDLSNSYIQDNSFECSSVDILAKCVERANLRCAIGATSEIEALVKLDLEAEIHQCRLKEADLTCSVDQIAATQKYVGQGCPCQIGTERLCWIVAVSRDKVKRAEAQCTKDQIAAIKGAQARLEAAIGKLNCAANNTNDTVIISNECKPTDALLCQNKVLGNADIKTSITCQSLADIAACMKPLLQNCSSSTQLLLVNNQIDSLKSFLPANTNCLNVTLVENLNPAMNPVTDCLHLFLAALQSDCICTFFKKIKELKSCISSIKKEDILALEVTEKLEIGVILDTVNNIQEIESKGDINLTLTVSLQCIQPLNAVFYKHAAALFGLYSLPLDQRDGVCKAMNDNLAPMTSACGINETADVYKLIDKLREQLTGYCPELKPIPRCLPHFAESCFGRFETSIGLFSEANLCLEANIYVQCALPYTQSCARQDLAEVYKQAAIVADIVLQICAGQPELIDALRCKLLGHVDVTPGCDSNAASGCTAMPSDTCSAIEAKASCLTKNSGLCLEKLVPTVLTDSLSQISDCWYGDNSHSTDKTILSESCSSRIYPCNITKSKGCLTSIIGKTDASSYSQAKQCLDGSYYCFMSLSALIDTNSTHLASFEADLQAFSPDFASLESGFIRTWLTLSSNLGSLLNNNLVVNLNAWNICSGLTKYLNGINDTCNRYPIAQFSAIIQSQENVRRAIRKHCSDVEPELFQPPSEKEDPDCPLVTVKAVLSTLVRRLIFDLHTVENAGIEPICSLLNQAKQGVEASGQLSQQKCSDGIKAQVSFAYKIASSVLGTKCQKPDDIPRCAFDKVVNCAQAMFDNIWFLGKNQTFPELCKIYSETEACVEKYSYKCDSCTLSSIEHLFASVKPLPIGKCKSQALPLPLPECKDESQPKKCDVLATAKCATDQISNMVTPFTDDADKCRKLYENLLCFEENTGGCTPETPLEKVHQEIDSTKAILAKLGCKEEKPSNSSGCWDGCWLDKASECFDVFKQQTAHANLPEEQQTDCGRRNQLRVCVAENTKSCNESVAKLFLQNVDVALLQSGEKEDACIDQLQITIDFCQTTGEILNCNNVQVDSDHEDDNDDDSDTYDEDNDNSAGENNSSGRLNLNSLWLISQKLWIGMQNLLQTFSEDKKFILDSLLQVIWIQTKAKCSDTKALECYHCNNKDSVTDCEAKTEICPLNSACMFRQTYVNSTIKYSAGCTSATKCKNDSSSEKTFLCSTQLCNKKANANNKCDLQPASCKQERAWKCALNFVKSYTVSDTLDCSSAISDLQCIQKYSVGCTNTVGLSLVASRIHLHLARTYCVVNPGVTDMESLTIKLALTGLNNPYINEGNTVCVAQKEKISSVHDLIESGNCSFNATVSLKVALEFWSSIASTYCQNNCDKEITNVSTPTTQSCSWHALDGIEKVYTCGAEVAKPDGDCGIAAANSLSARQALRKCNISDYVYDTLNALDSKMKNKCHLPTLSDLPEVCPTVCQSAVVMNFVDEVNVAIKTHATYSRWYLTYVEDVYYKYTKGCTSIQQSDVANYIFSILVRHIEENQNKFPDFVFKLELKTDIFSSAALCLSNFRQEMKFALSSNDKKIGCSAAKQLRTCVWNLPELVSDYITRFPHDISAIYEQENMCGDVLNETTNRTKRDAAVCNKKRLLELSDLIILEHNFKIAAIDTRKMFCQNLDANIEEFKKIVNECTSSKELSPLQASQFNAVIRSAEDIRGNNCIPLRYEKDQCDLKRVKECWNDFIALSGHAGSEIDALCRVAKFTLECTHRFTTDCSADEDKAKVAAIRETTLTLLKGVVGNKCSELTGIFYCNASITSHVLACQLEEAQRYSKEISIDVFRIGEDKYCQVVATNVSKAQSAANGCDADQITSIKWPDVKDGFCGITDVSLNNVCKSLPLCPVKPLIACFNQSNQTCQSLEAAFACMKTYVSSHKQCQQDLGSFLIQHFFLVYYQTSVNSCKIQFSISVPYPLALAGVEKLVETVNVALSYSKTTATATEIVNNIYNKTVAALKPDDPITYLILAILNRVASTSSVKPVEYNNQTDPPYMDKDSCYLTRAKACIGQQMLQMVLIKTLSLDVIDMICSNWNINYMDVCLKDAVSSCSPEDKNKFMQIGSEISTAFAALDVCGKPNVCLVSEAYLCKNPLMTKIYHANRSIDDVCLARLDAQACLNSYLSTCSAEMGKPVRDEFKEISDALDDMCKDFVNPEPLLCPSIRGGDRVCAIGTAFSCFANLPIFSTVADSFTLRDQCLDMQKMMVCIAKKTTSCDAKDPDVKDMLASVKQLKASFVNACPYLTEDFCSIQTYCPVMTAGCDTEMERQLSNKQIPVCDTKQAADACVDNYTTTCTQAQKVQARGVINNKLALLGLSKGLSCQAGSIDPCLYSFLAAVRGIYKNSQAKQNCDLLASQYTCILSSYPNIGQSMNRDLGKDLIDKLKAITTASQCSATVNSTCTNLALVNKLTVLIEELILNTNFSDIAFCAKSQYILREKKANDCNVALFDAITNSMAYKQKCANEKIACDVAAVNVQECIKKIGVFSALSCADKQKAANCITENLPWYCSYNSSWLDGAFCNENFVLQITSEIGKKNYISESGLSLVVSLKIVAGGTGSRHITLKMTAQAKNDSSTASSEVKDKTPKVYTNKNPQKLPDGSSEFKFNINAVQDYRTGGHRTVIVQFIATPYQLTTDPVTGQPVETAMNNMNFTVLTLTIYVEDATPLHFTCSSLNDPHVETFDHLFFDYLVSGIYTLIRHLTKPIAVVAEAYQCSAYGGTCNCAATVFSGKSYVKFSVCTGKAIITLKPEKRSTTTESLGMRVFLEKNLQKVHVLLLRTGIIVSIINKDTYLQVTIKATALDIAQLQGLCGNFNTYGFDEYELPNGTTHILTKTDTQFGVVNPLAFVEAWKLSTADATDPTKVLAPTVMSSDEALEPACYSWITSNSEDSRCSPTVPYNIYGLISGNDETDSLLALSNQDISTAAKKRKKRQAVFEDQPSNSTVRVNLSQPTWNQSKATDFCMDNMFNPPLRACRDAILSLNDTRYLTAFDIPLKICVQDLQLTGDTMWLEASRVAAIEKCQEIISQNPQMASNLAAAFLNMRCDPFDCNGHGNCSNGLCNCDSNYAGTKCDVHVSDLNKQPYLTLNEDDEAYLCEITFASNCSSVFVSGGNFVSSDFLACHIREVEITETGVKTLAPGEVTTVKGELITTNQVKCDLGSQSYIKRSVEVSVSNDGKTPYKKYQTFIAFDPVCYDCNLYSCKKKKNVCIIGNRCVAEGQTSVYNDCQYCNLSSPNIWSIRLDKPECESLIPKPAGDDTDKQTLTTALIAVGCSAVILVIILVTVCCIMKRRQKGRRRRSAQTDGTDNPSFHEMPFTGKPIPAYKARQWADSNVSPPSYNQYA